MEQILIFIKHNLKFLWVIIEWTNDIIFHLKYKDKIDENIDDLFIESNGGEFIYRRLNKSDLEALFSFISSQGKEDLKYFKPHGFEYESIKQQFKKVSFLMMGAFHKNDLIGYFFLRFFVNKRCFVGRIIDIGYRGKGVGKVMNKIMYNLAWRMKFRCLSTISKNNNAVLRAHSKNKNMIVLKELKNDYLLVEFLPEQIILEN